MSDEMVLAEVSQQYGPTEQHVLNIVSQLPPDSFVRNYVNVVSQFSDTHVAHHVLGAISVMAQLVPNHIGFPFGANPIHANIFGMLVGSSGSRKTVAVSTARKLLKQTHAEIVAEQPASREALYQEVSDCAKKFIAYTEFGDFLAASRGNSYLTPLRTAYNDAADCSPLHRVRVRRRNRDGNVEDGDGLGCESPRVSVLGAVAGPFLDAHTEASDWGGGFFARFLTSCYERERFIALPEDGEGKIAYGVIPFLKSHYENWCMIPPFGERLYFGRCGGFAPDARADYVRWARALDRPANSTIAVSAATNRLATMAIKLALVLAWDCMAPRFPWRGIENERIEHRGIPFGVSPAVEQEPWYIPNDIFHVAAQIVQDLHYRSVCEVVKGLADTPQERLLVAIRRTLEYADQNFWKYRDEPGFDGLTGPLTLGQLSKELRRDQRDISNAIITLKTRGDIGTRESAGGGGQRFYLIGGAVDRMVSIESVQQTRTLFGGEG